MAEKYDDCELCGKNGMFRWGLLPKNGICPLCAMRARAEAEHQRITQLEFEIGRCDETLSRCGSPNVCATSDNDLAARVMVIFRQAGEAQAELARVKAGAEINGKTWLAYSDGLDERITELERDIEQSKMALGNLGVSDDYNGWDRLSVAGRIIKLGKEIDAARRELAETQTKSDYIEDERDYFRRSAYKAKDQFVATIAQRDAARNWARAWKALSHLLFDLLNDMPHRDPTLRMLRYENEYRHAMAMCEEKRAQEKKASGK